MKSILIILFSLLTLCVQSQNTVTLTTFRQKCEQIISHLLTIRTSISDMKKGPYETSEEFAERKRNFKANNRKEAQKIFSSYEGKFVIVIENPNGFYDADNEILTVEKIRINVLKTEFFVGQRMGCNSFNDQIAHLIMAWDDNNNRQYNMHYIDIKGFKYPVDIRKAREINVNENRGRIEMSCELSLGYRYDYAYIISLDIKSVFWYLNEKQINPWPWCHQFIPDPDPDPDPNLDHIPDPVYKFRSTIKDSRDGKTYNTVQIGDQRWMAENLNYNSENSWCYENSNSNCQKYGRLYTWQAALKACPKGWHLPSYKEWMILVGKVDRKFDVEDHEWDDSPSPGFDAGKKLKSQIGWVSEGNGTDEYAFSALPGGSRTYDGGYDRLEKYAYFWSSTEFNRYDAWGLGLHFVDVRVNRYTGDKARGFSVRCVKD